MLFFSKTKSGCYHLCGDSSMPRHLQCYSAYSSVEHACEDGVHIRYTEEQEIRKLLAARPGLRSLPFRPNLKTGNWLTSRVCETCLDIVRGQFKTEIGATMQKIDVTRPFVVGPDGSLFQADKKTIGAAKELAKELAGKNDCEYVVFTPHTSYAPKKTPIVEKRLKVR